MGDPELSIVVAVFNMARVAPRTLHSLSSDYQIGVKAAEYEVIVVDNGSTPPIAADMVCAHGPNFRHERIREPRPSPAAAMNRGVELARGRWIGLIVDGARMATPGLIGNALATLREDPDGVVETVAFVLGPDLLDEAARASFDEQAEDALLDQIGWPANGYRLLEVSTLAPSSGKGWRGPMNESSCLFLGREEFVRLGGFDERFDQPGGGFLTMDMYRRVCDGCSSTIYRLLGEATFHQMHGGAATGLPTRARRRKGRAWRRQYRRLRGGSMVTPTHQPVFRGDDG